MNFASDNAGPVHPKILSAITRANDGYAMPYGNDDLTQLANARVRAAFDAPEAEVFLLPGIGTAANALALSCLTPPWGTMFCHRMAHVQKDECNAPEFFSGGAKLTLVDGPAAKMDPASLAQALTSVGGSVHNAQRGPVTLSQATERGTVYTLPELQEIAHQARRFGSALHMDGARFANAAACLNAHPADGSWKAGVDVLSFGGTKNGCLGLEAVIFFDPAQAQDFALRRKRGAQLSSKHRFLAAQMVAYLEDDLWLTMAQAANATADRLAVGLAQHPDVTLTEPHGANMLFASWPRALHQKLIAAGAQYYPSADIGAGPADAPIEARLVCDWSCDAAKVDHFLSLMRAG